MGRYKDFAMTDHKKRELRSTSRKKTLREGTIVFRNDSCTMGCAILDLAEGGAKLRPTDVTLLPESFRLIIKHGPSRQCEVVRRTRDQIAVRFI